FQDRTRFIERMKAVGQLEQVIGQNIRPKIVQYLRDDLGELTKFFRQRDLGRLVQDKRWSHGALPPCFAPTERGGYTRFAKDGADPDIRVLKIWRGVSLQSQHFVPGKHVIGHPILRKIGILDRADADDLRDVDLFGFV